MPKIEQASYITLVQAVHFLATGKSLTPEQLWQQFMDNIPPWKEVEARRKAAKRGLPSPRADGPTLSELWEKSLQALIAAHLAGTVSLVRAGQRIPNELLACDLMLTMNSKLVLTNSDDVRARGDRDDDSCVVKLLAHEFNKVFIEKQNGTPVKSGRGYKEADRPLIAEMKAIIDKKRCSVWRAAQDVVARAEGSSSEDSKIRRLVGGLKETYPT